MILESMRLAFRHIITLCLGVREGGEGGVGLQTHIRSIFAYNTIHFLRGELLTSMLMTTIGFAF